MSIRAHLYELKDNCECFGNEERLIARLERKIYNDEYDFNRDSVVICRSDMELIVKMLREIAKEDGDMWDWAKEQCESDIIMFGDENEWRHWCSDLADDIERSLSESDADDFLIWYY